MNWTEVLFKYGILPVIAAIAVWVWRDGVWEAKIANAPISRDTVTVHDTTTVVVQLPARLVPDPRIDTILTSENCDSLVRDLSQIASLDTMISDTRIEVSYIPLDHRFTLRTTDFHKHVIISNTKTVYAEPHWLQYAGLGISAFITGVGIANEDPYMVGGGLIGVTIVSITF